jgi:hypothetical protein
LCTGLAKLWALETIGLDADAIADIRWRNAVRIFPPHAFPNVSQPRDARPQKATVA